MGVLFASTGIRAYLVFMRITTVCVLVLAGCSYEVLPSSISSPPVAQSFIPQTTPEDAEPADFAEAAAIRDLAEQVEAKLVRDLEDPVDLSSPADLVPAVDLAGSDLRGACSAPGDVCCPGSKCADGLSCDVNQLVNGNALCRTCGHVVDQTCILNTGVRCLEPCCPGAGCAGGACLRAHGFSDLCIQCPGNDPTCTLCGHAGEPCCLGLLCHGLLSCQGPDRNGKNHCF